MTHNTIRYGVPIGRTRLPVYTLSTVRIRPPLSSSPTSVISPVNRNEHEGDAKVPIFVKPNPPTLVLVPSYLVEKFFSLLLLLIDHFSRQTQSLPHFLPSEPSS